MHENWRYFFDIETLKANTTAKPAEHQVVEYAVTAEYDWRRKHYEKLYPNLYYFIEDMLKIKTKKIVLFAHNGEKYDFHFLRRMLIDYYGLTPQNGFMRNSLKHDFEVSAKDLKGDYLLEYRVKSKTSLELKFRLDNTVFSTADTYPKFQASIATMGKLLFHHGIIKEEDEKLDYDYVKYDKKNRYDQLELRNYAMKVYNSLTEHERNYVHNDTHILYTAYKNFGKLFPGFDKKKRTLSQNILKVYEVNDLAYLQLLCKHREQKINYSEFNFDGEDLFTYLHRYYKGGLNFYNDKFVGTIQRNFTHIDLNSSYPTAMYQNAYPTFLLDGKVINSKLKFDQRYYYFVKISKESFNLYLKNINSDIVKEMFVKYFNNPTGFVYLQTPHIKLLSMFLKKEIKEMPVVSYLKWQAEPFGARDVIKKYYQEKVEAKKNHLTFGEIYTKKVILNGIYGIPALRAHYNVFKSEDKGLTYTNFINGFKNTERNIVFASAVTAYSLLQLLTPLTYNVSSIDDGFMYCDTDSLFLREDYYATISDHVKIDKFELGAWDKEHVHVDEMYVLNHKKYALCTDNKIEVTAGGVPQSTFKKNMSFQKFIDTQFHDHAKLLVTKNFFTNDQVITIYEADTELNLGSNYLKYYDKESNEKYIMTLGYIFEQEVNSNEEGSDTLYYETPFGAISVADAFPFKYETKYNTNIKTLIMYFRRLKEEIAI